MPGSVRENDEFVKKFVRDKNIDFVLDVGAGQGTYSDLLRSQVALIDAIEVWQPYVDEFDLKSKYNTVYTKDARVHDDFLYHLVVFGDILEHMSEQDAVTLFKTAGSMADWCLISVPIIHYPQGEEHGNPYEVHVQDHLTPEKVRELFGPFDYEEIYEVTGTFIRRFN